MHKKSFYTTSGIILSFVLAIGGWVLTSHMIERKSNGLRSATLPVAISTVYQTLVDQTSTGPDTVSYDYIDVRRSLSEDEIVQILRNWDSSYPEMPHEPTSGQLHMEQAVEIGKEWLSFLNGLRIFPEEFLAFSDTRAYLYQKIPVGQGGTFLPSAYSYWTVIFTNDSMSIDMDIHALTGEVWKTEIQLFRLDVDIGAYTMTSALAAFVKALEINCEDNVRSVNSTVPEDYAAPKEPDEIFDIVTSVNGSVEFVTSSQKFADVSAYAAMTATLCYRDDTVIVEYLKLFLTGQNPHQ